MVSYVSALLYGVGGIVMAWMALLVAFQERLVYVPVLAHFFSPTILFFQENAGNIVHRLEMVRIMLQQLQCNVFMLSYRRYGASDGYPSLHVITKDVFGRSPGGAVGAVLTQNNSDKVAGLILENTFTSILDMAGVLLPFGGAAGSKGPKILNCVVCSPWSTIDVVGKIKQPILFLSGLQDEMVPSFHMQMLYAKAATYNNNCTFVDFPTGMHMDTWLASGDRYWRTIQLFFERVVPEKKEVAQPCSDDDSSSS